MIYCQRVSFRLVALVLMAIIFLPQQAYAQIAISDVLIQFKTGKRPIQNITVRNHSDDAIFVTAEAEQVLNPGDKNSERQATDNLLVAPIRFSIDPQGQRTVRLLLKKMPQEKEEIYRVKFLPQLRSFDVEEKSTARRQAIIKVLTGMGVLIFVDPVQPVHNFTWERTSTGITFTNNGNRNVRLTDGKVCKKGQDDKCEEIKGQRIYSGDSYTIEVPKETTVTYMKQDGYDGDIEFITIE